MNVTSSVPLPSGFGLKPRVHWFGDAAGSFDYGSEFDLLVVKRFNENWSFLAAMGLYDADSYATDEQFFAIQIEYKY